MYTVKRIKIMKSFIFCLVVIAFSYSIGSCGETLVLSTDDVYPRSTPEGTGFEDLILKEAFQRIGVSIKISSLPAERALINVNQGIDDGLFVKIAGVEESYPNLIMVPEKICDYDFAAFTKNPSIQINGWDSLKPYNVGFLRGWKMYEANIKEAKSITKVKDDEALIELLNHDRVDIIAYELLEMKVRSKKMNLTGIITLQPLLAKKDMFCYLNRKHSKLVPGLVQALKDMKADGTYNKIMTSAMEKLE